MDTTITTELQRLNVLPLTPDVNALWLIGLQANTGPFQDFCEEMLNCSDPHAKLRKVFPDLEERVSNFDDEWQAGELADNLPRCQYNGFLVELGIPHCEQFKYDEAGKPLRWRVVHAVNRVEHCYGNTLEELITAIQYRVNEVFAEFMEEDKQRQAR